MLKKIVAAAALAMLASSSFAATPGTIYAGADLGSTKVTGTSAETSFGAFVGYNFHESFAVEGGYRRLASFDLGAYGDAEYDQLAVSVVGSLPLSNGFSVFGRLGLNRVSVDTDYGSANDTGTLYGVGVGYAFSDKISARVEVQRPESDVTNLSIGVAYKF